MSDQRPFKRRYFEVKSEPTGLVRWAQRRVEEWFLHGEPLEREPTAREVRLLTVLLDHHAKPIELYVMRLENGVDGRVTRKCQEVLADCLGVLRPKIPWAGASENEEHPGLNFNLGWQLQGWPADFGYHLADAFEVPVKAIPETMIFGGVLLAAGQMQLSAPYMMHAYWKTQAELREQGQKVYVKG